MIINVWIGLTYSLVARSCRDGLFVDEPDLRVPEANAVHRSALKQLLAIHISAMIASRLLLHPKQHCEAALPRDGRPKLVKLTSSSRPTQVPNKRPILPKYFTVATLPLC